MNNNRNWRVVTLISISFFIYLIFSILSFAFDIKWEPFEKVNLITDVFDKYKKSQLVQNNNTDINSPNQNGASQNLVQDFELYKKPHFITNFYKGDSVNALSNFSEKLHQLQTSKKGKIRIAYFGDSMIEGDLLTQTLRKLLQKEFGGYGVGFLPIHSKVAGFRQTASVQSSGWETINFMDKGAKNMYISGFSFSGFGNGTFTDKTKSFVSHELAEKLKKAQTGDVIITNTSENIEDVGKSVVWCGSGEIVTGGHATIFKPKLVSGKYFAYYTQTRAFYSEKRKYAKGTKVIDVSATDMAKIKIPIPPLAEQNRIVAILDKFDALTTDISTGLPAELAARRKQYEYYRNKLLTFEEKKGVASV